MAYQPFGYMPPYGGCPSNYCPVRRVEYHVSLSGQPISPGASPVFSTTVAAGYLPSCYTVPPSSAFLAHDHPPGLGFSNRYY